MYQSTKGISVSISLVIIFILQMAFPYRSYQGLPFKIRVKNGIINLILAMVNVLIVNALCGSCLIYGAQLTREQGIGLTQGWPMGIRLLVSLIALDFTAYFWHRLNHRLNFLWRYHQVHHSEEVFDGTTAFRFHFGEVLISLGVRLGVVIALGLPWEGILFFEVVYGFANVFQHGSFILPRGFETHLQKLLITPGLHRKHHSSLFQHRDRNFGTIFSFWDRVGGSCIGGFSTEDDYLVGLPKDLGDGEKREIKPKIFSVWYLLVMPFVRGR
jgi:sterol desaturase/sphingolipid hydroxylase (fatty acid hydroxylase superfamily)